jgi:NADPH:quinone reductase-like Zn-dependent oxidoreductase
MKAVVFDRIGPPQEVLELREVPMPRIGDDEVLIKMISAPISPGDFLFIQNLYPEPKKPKFPQQIAGNHGVGIVERAGKNARVKVGTYVGFSYYNSWAEYAAIPAEWLMPMPPRFPPEKASQFFNLITAWDLLAAARVERSDWLAVTAGNSTVSMMVLQFAKARGVKVISIVRRPQSDLKKLGASEVIVLATLPGTIRARVGEITGGKGLNAFVDSVGGPLTGELIRSMAFGGQVVINGGMSAERFELHNFDILLSGLEIRSHVYRYLLRAPRPSEMEELTQIAAASAAPDFKVAVGGLNKLEQFETAVRETLERPERGKQFFELHSLEHLPTSKSRSPRCTLPAPSIGFGGC